LQQNHADQENSTPAPEQAKSSLAPAQTQQQLENRSTDTRPKVKTYSFQSFVALESAKQDARDIPSLKKAIKKAKADGLPLGS
jgi:hypothetical protein